MSVLFPEAFDVWFDNSSSFYKLSCGWVWLFVGFLLGFALLKELCLVVVVLYDFVKVIHFLCKQFRCRTYLSSSVDEGVDKIVLLKWGG